MQIVPQSWMRRLAARGLVPRSALARITVYLAALYLLLAITRAILNAAGSTRRAAGLSGWITGLGWVVAVLVFVMFIAWARRRLLWRLRNRLIITYVFIGVIPVALLLLMASLAGYLFVGQFATFIAASDLKAELAQLKISNDELGTQVAAELNSGVAPEKVAQILRSAEQGEAGRSAHFWLGGKGFQARGTAGESDPGKLPAWVERELGREHEFHSFLVSEGKLRFFAARQSSAKDQPLIVASSMPLTPAMLAHLAERIGAISIYGPHSAAGHSAHRDLAPLVSGGTLPPGEWWDGEVALVTSLDAREWRSGRQAELETLVRSRKSLLYRRLVGTLGTGASAYMVALSLAAVAFGIIELVALWVGVRLTRSMTFAVAQLYSATQRVNRGDFSHRIAVRSNDQLAALEGSFNSMIASIERLLAEQQEKQRIENELSIAQEVQNQLFPRNSIEVKTLEVYGLCRPARTVSGDYFDFLPLGGNRLGLALGDISGKGISAALLMATLHSAVRSLMMLPAQSPAAVEVAGARSAATLAEPEEGSPARWLALLNRHLYHSTAPEKYATLFVAVYDGDSRRLTYSNGGHLAPLVLSRDNGVRRLECGGMAIGLFDDMSYEESSIAMATGDIFVAYSDGITEPENEFGEFGEQRLLELIRENSDLPLERIAAEVTAAVSDWIGSAEQPDDITLVLARVR